MNIRIYTDGSVDRNPGRGGYAAIIHGEPSGERIVRGGFVLTTNNRMEILAAVAALESLSAPTGVEIVTDSRYLIDGCQWARGWRARGWRLGSRKHGPVKNVDLWTRLLAECERHAVAWVWVRGHAGHPQNERCDGLAAMAARTATAVDIGYGTDS